MLKPINTIIKDSIGQIIYKGNVVTGIVETDNGNNSYDVLISESALAYPNIYTLSQSPDINVGDKVRILYENGCKEKPIILPPVAEVTRIIFVIYGTDANYVKTFCKDDGALISEFSIAENVYWETDTFCVDKNNNFYYLDVSGVLYKKGRTGNAITSINLSANPPEAIAIGYDGYLYLRIQDNTIQKRLTSDLSSIETVLTLSAGKSYYGLVLDSDGYFYVSNATDDRMEKWSASGIIATQSISDGAANSLCVISNILAWAHNAGSHGAYSMLKNLSSGESDFPLGEIDDNVTGASSIDGSYFLFVGDNDLGNVQFQKYTSEKVLSYVKEVETSETWNTYSHIAAYPF